MLRDGSKAGIFAGLLVRVWILAVLSQALVGLLNVRRGFYDLRMLFGFSHGDIVKLSLKKTTQLSVGVRGSSELRWDCAPWVPDIVYIVRSI